MLALGLALGSILHDFALRASHTGATVAQARERRTALSHLLTHLSEWHPTIF